MSYTQVYANTLIPAKLKEGQLQELLVLAAKELNQLEGSAYDAFAEDEGEDVTDKLFEELKEQVTHQNGKLIISTDNESCALVGEGAEELADILIRETDAPYSYGTYSEIDSRDGGFSDAWIQSRNGKVYGMQELAELVSSLDALNEED